MVTVTDHRLAVSGLTYNPSKENAFIMPTAFSPATIKYGADTCSDNPSPTTLQGRLFIPNDYAEFFPVLNDPVTYTFSSGGGNVAPFSGRIDGITIEDVPGAQPPAAFPQSRTITATDRWVFRDGSIDAPGAVLPVVLDSSKPSRVGMAPTTQPLQTYGTMTTPPAPVTPAVEYKFTALAFGAISGFTAVAFTWYNAAGEVISVVYPGSIYMPTNNLLFSSLATYPATAPPAAVTVTISVQLDVNSSYEPVVYLDTVNLVTPAQAKERPAGRWVTFQASDATATAGRIMVGDIPWRPETVWSRLSRLNAIIPNRVVKFSTPTIDVTQLAYRDVDKQSSLALFQRIVSSIGNVALANPQYEMEISTAADPRSPLSLEVVSGNPVLVEDPSLAHLPAGCIRSGPMSTSITGLSNTVQFNYREGNNDGSEDASVSITNATSVTAYGPMARTVDTDLPAPAGLAWDRAQRLIQKQATPYYRLADNAKVIVDQLPNVPASGSLFGAMTGFRRLVYIPDAPAIIGPYHRIHAASMTFGKTTELELELEPADLIPVTTVSFYDLSRYPYYNMPFSKFTSLTFKDMGAASKAAGS